MCGIAGIAGEGSKLLPEMLNKISKRGPDARGVFEVNTSMTLGHNRLSIIDIDERSNQPFFSECGNYILCFNGEIYNYKSLRKKLLDKAYKFTTQSDTEVLLKWFMEFGFAGLKKLDGMFAFAVFDRIKNQITLVRDHIGEKPLYYSSDSQNFSFCSEISGLRILPWVDQSLCQEALKNYLLFLYTPAPQTLYQGIKELEPGATIVYNLNSKSLDSRFFYKLEDTILSSESIHTAVSEAEIVSQFRDIFSQSTNLRLNADVPLGLFLSAGLDSNAIFANLRDTELKYQPKTYTADYSKSKQGAFYDERQLAKKVSEDFGIENIPYVFDQATSIFDEGLRVLELFDQPFGNSTALVADSISSIASKSSKVCLVGDGGDEALIGYPRYKALLIKEKLDALPQGMKNGFLKTLNLFKEDGRFSNQIRRLKTFFMSSERTREEAILDWVTYIDTEKYKTIFQTSHLTDFYGSLLNLAYQYEDKVLAASLIDFKSFVPYNLCQSADRTGMNHSLELRSPFLSTKVIEYCLKIPTKHKVSFLSNKPILKKAFEDKIPNYILKQKKKPFNPPLADFLRKYYKDLEAYLMRPQSQLKSIFPHGFLSKELSDFSNKFRDNSTFLWGLFTLELWFDQ